jgi:hypothetical protein
MRDREPGSDRSIVWWRRNGSSRSVYFEIVNLNAQHHFRYLNDIILQSTHIFRDRFDLKGLSNLLFLPFVVELHPHGRSNGAIRSHGGLDNRNGNGK